MEKQILEAGAIFAIAYVAIQGLVSVVKLLKTPKNGEKSELKQIIGELEKQNTNHLTHITEMMWNMCNRISDGNNAIVKAVNDMHQDMLRELGEIKEELARK